MAEPSSVLPSQWCLIGNIVEERPYGEGSAEIKYGTMHFSPGTKVYCLPARWGDGYEKIMVIGRHRGSRQLVRMVIRSDWVTNWRAKVLYSPQVLRLIQEEWHAPWSSQEQVERYVSFLKERETALRLSGQEAVEDG
jgi:hypothetical protein